MHRDDPAHMSIDERLDELASLLAVGFLRLKRRTGCPPPGVFLTATQNRSLTVAALIMRHSRARKVRKSRRIRLAIFRKTRPPVPRVNGERPENAWRPTWRND